MNIKLSEKYDYSNIANRLRIAADSLESLGTIGKVECDNFIKKNNLEYIAEEIEIAFREGFKVGVLYQKQEAANEQTTI